MARPKILVSNDDGYDTPGIIVLADAMRKIGDVCVFAPSKNCSGASAALTLRGNLIVEQKDARTWSVTGTPADCVNMALSGSCELPWKRSEIALTVTGINHGANICADAIYSGTIAAAQESALFGVPGVAFSLVCNFATVMDTSSFAAPGEFASQLVSNILDGRQIPKDMLLNVNFPATVADSPPRAMVTSLGGGAPERTIVKQWENADEKRCCYHYGNNNFERIDEQGTDLWAVERGIVSVTPLRLNHTAADTLADSLPAWLP